MSWNWGVFAIALIVCTIVVMVARGATNSANIAKYGPRADYAAEPAAAIAGSIAAGAVLAAVITVVAGLF
jgi:hypothetical protein